MPIENKNPAAVCTMKDYRHLYDINIYGAYSLKNSYEAKNITESNEVFSMLLYNLLREKSENLVFSPFSISTVMAMLSVGAMEETLYQIENVLFFPSTFRVEYEKIIPALRSNDEFTLATANTIFMKDTFHIKQSFKRIMERSFHSDIRSLDFGESERAAKIINGWVEKKTSNKIMNLINPKELDEQTQMVLVNAIYFKSEWHKKFDKIIQRKFFVSRSNIVEVPMLEKVDKVFVASLKSLSSTMIELPYKGKRIVMQILLPHSKYGLTAVENKLKSTNVQRLFEKKKTKTKIKIRLPKFKLESELQLKEDFKNLGLVDMFSFAADFSNITPYGLFVSMVKQKAIIEVDEEGTIAAAATAAILRWRSAIIGPPSFVADHAFIFYLRDKKTGMLLFQGRVVNPLE